MSVTSHRADPTTGGEAVGEEAAGVEPGHAGELAAGRRVVLADDEPELDLHEGELATLTRVDTADREVEFVLDDGREFTADATSVAPAPGDGEAAEVEDAPGLW